MGKDPRRIREEIEATRERMTETVEAIGYRADVPSRLKENISDRMDSVKGKLSDRVDAVKSKVGGWSQNVSDAMPSGDDLRRSATRAVSIAKENPIGLALGGVAVGFVAGLLIPATRAETETVQPMAENMKRKVQDASQTVVEHGKQVLQDVAGTVKESVQRHGQQVASEVSGKPGGSQSASGAGRPGNVNHNRDLREPADTQSSTSSGSQVTGSAAGRGPDAP